MISILLTLTLLSQSLQAKTFVFITQFQNVVANIQFYSQFLYEPYGFRKLLVSDRFMS